MPINLSPQEEEVIKIISPRKFHRVFTLPATENHDPLKVSFALVGPEDGDVPTILLCDGMFSSRWHTIGYEHLAQKAGVRVVSIDRPGFGASTPVPLSSRLPIFLETVTALLSFLGIKHVSLVSHSAGTVFALNLLHHHPSLLSPTHPTLTLISPWVHQSQTSVSFLVAASSLPNPVLNYWDDVCGFIVNRASPTLASSSGVLSAFAGVFGGKDGKNVEEEERKCKEGYGISLSVRKELEKMTSKYIFEENTKGANDEARLCLKSTEGCGWDACEDYPEFVKNLKQSWEKKTDGEGGTGKLKVKIVFAEEDAMIGKKGMEYFKGCWTQEKCGRGVEVECLQIEGTDHDSVKNPDIGFMQSMFLTAKENGRSE
ncbi:MAG: hypothetical protein M1818_001833 [Claussenomyces sp. TS43310]|nr:MAG: hypothetical protein M1818_001833 [Claussenomyces sp. TS43310]